MGQYLGGAIDSGITVIGVAKKYFKGSNPVEVIRGKSKKSLYVTAHGIDLQEAKRIIETIHGNYRILTLLKEVDRISREMAYSQIFILLHLKK
ncbi:hypothetical protein JW935_24420 [candidate division KSB1 bacterium]|nr:hypothetical protein [candidate division KSB1 bacterium]